jgi:hypothetical protein
MMCTSPQATVALLARGMRIGIASHGHKAINRLLQEMAKVASILVCASVGSRRAAAKTNVLKAGADDLHLGGCRQPLALVQRQADGRGDSKALNLHYLGLGHAPDPSSAISLTRQTSFAMVPTLQQSLTLLDDGRPPLCMLSFHSAPTAKRRLAGFFSSPFAVATPMVNRPPNRMLFWR